jgi:hypothetical protein
VGKTLEQLSKFKTITIPVDDFQDILHERDSLNTQVPQTMKEARTIIKPVTVSSAEGQRASSMSNMTTVEIHC